MFSGGHVVLPLLKQAMVDPWLDERQHISDRLWSRASYRRSSRASGAVIALRAIILPGMLLISGAGMKTGK